ncbi:MAG: NUDIX hydrolase [Roseburia sp.]|nr:NUDIX hydrolase [Roseburia sp.]
MKFKGIRKKEAGKFITRYDITYETVDNQEKIYEIISRRRDMETFEALHGDKPDAVVIIATDESGEKILVNREFRMAVGDWVYNFPAGLIDDGEAPEQSAKRELWEETGLELYEINDTIGPSYSAVGFSNEINVCIVGKARGEFRGSTSTMEEIEAGWYTRAQMRELLKTQRFAARTQAYCYLWSREQHA